MDTDYIKKIEYYIEYVYNEIVAHFSTSNPGIAFAETNYRIKNGQRPQEILIYQALTDNHRHLVVKELLFSWKNKESYNYGS